MWHLKRKGPFLHCSFWHLNIYRFFWQFIHTKCPLSGQFVGKIKYQRSFNTLTKMRKRMIQRSLCQCCIIHLLYISVFVFTHSLRGSGSILSFREFSSRFLFLTISFRRTHTQTHTHARTHTHKCSCIWPHTWFLNTTGYCRVVVWGVKVHTSRDKQYLFLRNNYLLQMSNGCCHSKSLNPCLFFWGNIFVSIFEPKGI